MKTFKLDQHSLFPKPFGLRGQMYLAVGICVFFDLTDGDTLLTEQEMWQTVPEQLGAIPILDFGMPKPRSEFLAAGSCFAPRGESRPASRVRIQVGEVDKSLNVFGDRYWKNGSITEAKPFEEMPVDWAHAFGGPEFAANRTGKGGQEVLLQDGTTVVPLPNIELAAQQIGSQNDRPDPAGFGQLDLEHPVRAGKNGTFDDKWKEERWPYFPDDIDYEFFNVACEDQFAKEYFQGGESYTVENMHPDMPLIQSQLPNLRMRAFVTANPEYKHHVFPTGPLPSEQLRETDEFREVPMHLETVWFFPSILRGVCVYRGTTPIDDEEGMDIPRILIRHEDPAEEPRSLEYYRDMQIRLLNRGVDVDMSPFEAAATKAREAMVKVKNLPKLVDGMRKKALGKAPKMPMPAPAEMGAMAEKQIAMHTANLDKLEAMAQGMQAKHGHLVEIDLNVFNRARAKLSDTKMKIDGAVEKMTATQEKLEKKRLAAVKKANDQISAIDPKMLAKADVSLDDKLFAEDFPLAKSVNPWHDTGFPLVVAARKQVDDHAECRKTLKDMGLKKAAVKTIWMGWNPEPVTTYASAWGLDGDEPVTLPQGLVLPGFDGPTLNRIQVFPAPVDCGTSQLVPGSDETPLFLPCATLIDLPTMPAASGAPVVVVADALQALFVEQEAGDFVSVLTLADPGETPGDDAAEALENAGTVLVMLPAQWKEDPALKAMWPLWEGALPEPQPMALEKGATVFEATDLGSDIRTWILDHLPPEVAQANDVDIKLPEAGKPPAKDFMKGFKPPIPDDIPGLVAGVTAEVKKAMEAKFAPAQAKQGAILEQAKGMLAKLKGKGLNVDIPELDMTPKGGPKKAPSEVVGKVVKTIEAQEAKLKKAGRMTPEIQQNFDTALARFRKLGQDFQALSDKLNAEFAAKTKELEAGLEQVKNMEPPAKAKEVFARQGLDPQKIRTLTREEVESLHAKGVSLSGYILNGVDLSGLDLSGADFSGCQMRGTVFKKAILDGATFVKALGKEADFSEASLKQANMERSVFPKALFDKADLNGVRFKQAVFKETSFKEADLRGADLDMAALDSIDATGADFREASLNMVVLGGDLSGADFRKARVHKSLFKETVVDKTDFRDATMPRSLFNTVTGKDVRFGGADLRHFRTGNNTAMPGADFSGTDLTDSVLRESDFTRADFSGAVMDRSLVEDSQLVQANLRRVVARGTRFTKSNLEGANLRGSNLHTSSLRKARLVNADLRGTNCYATDFYKAVLGKTRFDGANLTKTQLHNRFDLLDEDE